MVFNSSYVAVGLTEGCRFEWDGRTADPIGCDVINRTWGRGHQRGSPVWLEKKVPEKCWMKLFVEICFGIFWKIEKKPKFFHGNKKGKKNIQTKKSILKHDIILSKLGSFY